MPKKTAEIVLGGTTYTVHAFNIGEIEQVTNLVEDAAPGKNATMALAILAIALKRAEPAIADAKSIEIDSLDEVIAAANIIMELAGVKKTDANPPKVPAA